MSNAEPILRESGDKIRRGQERLVVLSNAGW